MAGRYVAHLLSLMPEALSSSCSYDWLQSMHKMCYCCEDLSADKMSFQEFLDST